MGFYSEVILPFLMDRELMDERFAEIRREVLRDAGGRVLEVGFGTGANLPCYPGSVNRLVVVEPSGGMSRRAHVASSQPRALRWQRRLNGMNAALGGGCQLTRDTERTIAEAGFAFERIERAPLPGGGLTPRWMFPAIWGTAVRG